MEELHPDYTLAFELGTGPETQSTQRSTRSQGIAVATVPPLELATLQAENVSRVDGPVDLTVSGEQPVANPLVAPTGSVTGDSNPAVLEGLLRGIASELRTLGGRIQDLEESRSSSARSRQSRRRESLGVVRAIEGDRDGLNETSLPGCGIAANVEGSPPGTSTAVPVPVASPAAEAMTQGMNYQIGPCIQPPSGTPVGTPEDWFTSGDQGYGEAYSPWVDPGVQAFYVGSPRPQGHVPAELDESGQGSGVSFVSLTETPEEQRNRVRREPPVVVAPTSGAQSVSAAAGPTGPISQCTVPIAMSPGMFVPPAWPTMPMWHLPHMPPVGPGIPGMPVVNPVFPYPVPPPPPVSNVFPLEDVPRPPPFSPPESPRVVGALNCTPEGTPIPPPPPVAGASVSLGISGVAGDSRGSGSSGFERIEEPSRLVMSLPSWDVAPGSQDASVAAGDWVARIKPLLMTLSPTAHKWWEGTHAKAYEFYQQWLTGQPSARLAVRAQVEAYHVDWGKLALVNERGAVLLLGALTTELQTECVTTRMLTAMGLLFTVLVKYQPGGPSEKAAVLAYLSSPDPPQGLLATQSALRRWLRLYNRTVELGLHKPDPTLLLRGLDRLGQLASKQAQAAFRLSSYRFEQRLDYEPSDDSVLAYAQVLLGEIEQQMLATEVPEKKPRVARADVNAESNSEGNNNPSGSPKASTPHQTKGKGKKGKGRDKGTPEQASSPQDSPKNICKGYLTAKGCAYGDNCRMQHDFASAGRQRLCFSCGSLDNRHQRHECPTLTNPKGSPKGKGKGKEKGKPKTAAMATSTANASAVTLRSQKSNHLQYQGQLCSR